MTQTSKPLMSPEAVAERLGVSVKTLWRMRAAGEFPRPMVIGKRSKRWKPEAVEAYLAKRETASC